MGSLAADVNTNGARGPAEFQRASACLPAELLLTAERVDGEHLARIAELRLGRRVQSSRGDRRSRLQ